MIGAFTLIYWESDIMGEFIEGLILKAFWASYIIHYIHKIQYATYIIGTKYFGPFNHDENVVDNINIDFYEQ